MLLEVKNISKSFGLTQVLREISMEVDTGEVHALLGLNGAGKSTLVNIISGTLGDFTGQILLEGEDIGNLTVLKRQKKGIYLVPQHAAVVPGYTVAENLFIGKWPKKTALTIDRAKMNALAVEYLREYGITFDPRTITEELALIDKRKLNIIRALHSNAKLIILDEPTTSLGAADRNELFDFINKLRGQGTSFIFISHYLDEVLRISDNVTVLRDGQAYRSEKEGNTEEILSRLIVGEDVELAQREPPKICEDKVLLECRGIVANGVEGVDMKVRQGEVIGMVGHPGSGARELARAIYGLSRIKSGSMQFHGKDVRPPRSTYEAMSRNLIYISNDRHAEGLVPMMSIYQNISLGIIRLWLRGKGGIINRRLERECVDTYYRRLKIKADSPSQQVDDLSGGNQQKVVVAKALNCRPEVLILDEPTIGIDVHTREEILGLVNQLTQEGKAALYITNDYNEMLRISDRLLFFHDGRIVQDIPNENLNPEQVIHLRDTIIKGGELV